MKLILQLIIISAIISLTGCNVISEDDTFDTTAAAGDSATTNENLSPRLRNNKTLVKHRLQQRRAVHRAHRLSN